MPVLKILIGIVSGFILVAALIARGSFLFVHFRVDDNYRKSVAEKEIEGANFGKTTDEAGCLSEGLKRSENITLVSPMVDQAKLEHFVKGCLPVSRPTKDFCEQVPADYALPVIEHWKSRKCLEAGLGEASSGCDYVFEQQINFCSR
jgi:hypothetical protein